MVKILQKLLLPLHRHKPLLNINLTTSWCCCISNKTVQKPDLMQSQHRHLCIHHRKYLQLESGLTHEEWDNQFWTRRKDLHSANKYKNDISKLFEKKSWFRRSPIEYRRMYFVLVKDEKNFSHVVDVNELRAKFDDPNVLATTHVSSYQLYPLIIPYRYLTSAEWDSILAQLLEEHSPSMTYTGIMEFILLRSSSEIKYDTSLDIKDTVESPVVVSFLDYILADDKLDNAQRALMNFMYLCHRLDRVDLIEKAYGRVRSRTKIFSPHFMLQCLELLQDTAYYEDIYQFCDILFHWFNLDSKQLLPVCARVALRKNDSETAFKWMASVMNPEDRGTKEPSIDAFLVKMLEQFGYCKDLIRWRHNRTVVEGFFSAMASTRVFPGQMGANAIENWFASIESESWKSGHFPFSSVKTNMCPLSGVKLKKKELADEEYQYLSKVVMREILLSSNQIDERGRVISLGFATADKREVKSFLSMLYETGPFDLVVDGMNVYYHVIGHSSKFRNEQSGAMCAAWLQHIIGLREKRMGRKLNVLVVFRGHLRRDVENLLDSFAKVWYTSDDTSDDLFFLYAAILCGKQCKLLTLDLLRDFRYHVVSRFDLLTVGLVFKWQQLHQDLVLLKKSKNLTPQMFDVSIHRSPNTWHFPYGDFTSSPTNWLMLKNLRS